MTSTLGARKNANVRLRQFPRLRVTGRGIGLRTDGCSCRSGCKRPRTATAEHSAKVEKGGFDLQLRLITDQPKSGGLSIGTFGIISIGGDTRVSHISWQFEPVDGTMATHPGVYCLRSNVLDWDAETMWRTYMTLTEAEAVFRALKSELGLRPVYHQKQHRANGHLFISVLAYQAVCVLCTRMKANG